MSALNTKNSHALRSFMTETVFDIDFTLPSDIGADNIKAASVEENHVAEPVNPESKPKQVLQVYGSNRKNILFIVDNADVTFFSREAELAFLKTLDAMKLNLSDVAVINRASLDPDLSFDTLKKELSPVYSVFLGSNPSDLHIGEYVENIWNQHDGVHLIKTHSFDEMLTDVDKKRAFWNAVKLINK